MNKIRVIDILNKIANGDEIKPFKLKGADGIIFFGECGKLLYKDDKEMVEWFIYSEWLNQEIEIIEEDKKIEKIEIYEDEDGHYFLNNRYNKIYIRCDETDFMVDKFNELIDEINNLKEK